MDSALDKYWTEALVLMEKEFSEVIFLTFIVPTTPLYMDQDFIVLQAKDLITRETIESRHISTITRVLKSLIHDEIHIKIVCPEDLLNKSSSNSSNLDVQSNPNAINSNIKSKYIFETFVRGKSNELAYAVSVAVAKDPGGAYNPLFLYGGVGLGKTHLMHSIGNFILEQNPEKKVLYCSTETFTNELITSIKNQKNQEFRNKYRGIDVLLIDDIQFLAEKEGTQEEFFHTFNTLYGDNKQIVISSDQPPREIKLLENRLRSRFASGVQFDITLPDFETRTAILEKKAEFDKIIIPKEVTKFIAKNIVSNIRDLEGALNKVIAYSKLTQTKITIELAETALSDIIGENEIKEISATFVQEIVCSHYKITTDEIVSKKRTQNITYPRHVAMYLVRKLMDLSLPQIGTAFGGRDHSTVIHGCDKIANDLENSTELKNILIELERKIKGE
jgi:chromosomal replication initiator protein